jgi:acyl-CoA synthetase (AMP-forming)/AMP-acid ligase II
VYLDKRIETVTAIFGTSAAGGVFVDQSPSALETGRHILDNCSVRILVTSAER